MKAKQQEIKTVFFKEVSKGQKSRLTLNVANVAQAYIVTQYSFFAARDEGTFERGYTQNMPK